MTTNQFKKPSNDVLKKILTPMQFSVTQEEGTEPAFHNAYWNQKAEGIYVDVVSGEPLFSTNNQYDSGCGWPSFTHPIQGTNVIEKTDSRYGMTRTEVRSKTADSHLGHIFPDGPKDQGGMRFCINSAALRFVPVSKLKEEGYDAYLKLFPH